MKKMLIGITFSLVITACSGYFDDSQSGGNQAQTLAVEGGGTLSQDTSDQITPFLYRDTNGQNPVLFYASNQDGDYDIYYARMNPNGLFESAGKLMGTNVNTAYDEKWPLVFWDNSLNSLPYITFMRYSNNVKQCITYELLDTTNFAVKNGGTYMKLVLSTNTTAIGLNRDSLSYSGTLLVFSKSSNRIEYDWNQLQPWGIGPTTNTNLGNSTLVSANEYSSTILFSYKLNSSVEEIVPIGKSQITVFGIAQNIQSTQFTIGVQQGIPVSYHSRYNDKSPFADWFDPNQEGKVYFSSDRATSKYFDLYRYNIDTMKKILNFYPFGEFLTNNNLTNYIGFL